MAFNTIDPASRGIPILKGIRLAVVRYDRRRKDVKVFISWSGERSKKIAEILKSWIKHVIQAVEPFVSSEDISKGTDWIAKITKELQETNFGILCVTKDNFQKPWLLFEAGALSKALDETYVVPFLFDLKPSDLIGSPLLQFQTTSYSQDEIRKLMATLNKACGQNALDEKEFDVTFNMWFPSLQEKLNEIEQVEMVEDDLQPTTKSDKTEQILEELLDLTRTNKKQLRIQGDKIMSLFAAVNLDTITQLYTNDIDYNIISNQYPANKFTWGDLNKRKSWGTGWSKLSEDERNFISRLALHELKQLTMMYEDNLPPNDPETPPSEESNP
jgi:hypothetical protein